MTTILEEHERLRQFLAKDPLDIERSFMTVPMIQQEAGELAARAIRVLDVAENNVKIARANVADRIRQILVHGKEPSQARIDSMLPKDEEVQQAEQVCRDAKYEASICRTLCESLKSQSMMMHKVADLVTAGFFQPSVLTDRAREEMRRARIAADQSKSGKEGRITRPTVNLLRGARHHGV